MHRSIEYLLTGYSSSPVLLLRYSVVIPEKNLLYIPYFRILCLYLLSGSLMNHKAMKKNNIILFFDKKNTVDRQLLWIYKLLFCSMFCWFFVIGKGKYMDYCANKSLKKPWFFSILIQVFNIKTRQEVLACNYSLTTNICMLKQYS